MKNFRKWTALIVLSSSFAWAQTNNSSTHLQSGATVSATEKMSTEDVTPVPSIPDSTKLELIESHQAVYPVEPIQGRVWLKLHVSEAGQVESVDVISGNPRLVEAAKQAAFKFRFKPYIRNGVAVKVAARYPFDFFFKENVAATDPKGILIRKIQPVYPPEAKHKGIQGTVVLQAVIGRDGNIESLTPVSGPKELIPAAIGAVGLWLYRPFIQNGEPREADTQITVNFQLSSK